MEFGGFYSTVAYMSVLGFALVADGMGSTGNRFERCSWAKPCDSGVSDPITGLLPPSLLSISA
jgi:hypothetical protein